MSTVVQDTKATNGLAQTFNIIYGVTPTEGNFLVAWCFHDETSPDIESLTSAGWTRMGTVAATLSGIDYRISAYAKFAGASESTTVAWDLGEINRRAHSYVVEFSGVPLVTLPAAESAASVTGVNGVTPTTSNQVDSSIQVGAGQFGLVMVGLNGASATPPSWASEVTENEDWSNNFRASAVGFVDPSVTIQPTATWGSGRHNIQVVFVLGDPIVPVTIKARSSFQIIKA